MNKKTLGFILLTIAIVFGLFETMYFGWNLFPKTIEEKICDGILVVLLLTSTWLINSSKTK